jgi:hypothetical protein
MFFSHHLSGSQKMRFGPVRHHFEMLCGVAVMVVLSTVTYARNFDFDGGIVNDYADSIAMPQRDAPIQRHSVMPIRLPRVRRSQAQVKDWLKPRKPRKNPLVPRGPWILTVPMPLPPMQLMATEDRANAVRKPMSIAEPEMTFSEQRAKALQSAQQGNWSDALRIWNEIRTRFPRNLAGYVGAGIALRQTGRLDEAENLLAEAAERFAANVPIALERARLANARRDWPEAARRWQAARPHFDDNPSACVGAGHALRQAGRLDESESLLAEAAERLPDNVLIALERARLANARRDWPKAVCRWQAIIERWPTELQGYLGAITTLKKAGRSNEVAALLPSARAALANAKQAGIDNIQSHRLELAIAQEDEADDD